MDTYSITDIKNKPSLIKSIDIAEIIDKKANITLGYFISSKYESHIKTLLEKLEKEEKEEKEEKLAKLKKHQDLEFTELGVDDGIK